MSDPVLGTIVSGLLGATAGAALLARRLRSVAEERRRPLERAALLGALAAATVALVAVERSGPLGWSGATLVGAPPFAIFVVSRSVTASVLVTLVPVYIFIATNVRERREFFSPETALDRAIPLEPAWMLVYGSIWVFVLLPLLVVRQRELLLRAARADIVLLLVSYASFLLLPTAAPRPDRLVVDGFAAWSLRVQYDIDPPFNCFPSLHVAHSFVSAFAAHRVHRGVGRLALAWAALIAVSTLYTKQHYVADAAAGALAAFAACVLFLRAPVPVPPEDRARAPRRALVVVALYGSVVLSSYLLYRFGY
ncbi:MAG: phosphatase PAP2 family protein [Vicinamibacteria bacterium]